MEQGWKISIYIGIRKKKKKKKQGKQQNAIRLLFSPLMRILGPVF